MRDTANYDEAWKEALDLYFQPLLSFFFPAVHALIDWQQPIQFLDKEFQQLIPAAQLGQRTADKLVQVALLSGTFALVLIHIEVQSQEDAKFAERMFVYHYRIYDRYRQPVISLAILGDENSRWRPQTFEYELGGSRLLLRFACVKLLDYEWQGLEESEEGIAMLVMAHLQTQRTVGDPAGRKSWKWELVRRLYERGYDPEQIRGLFRLIDWMMSLPQEMEEAFRQELYEYEERRQMPLISRMERDALEQGIQQGLTQGIQQGLTQGIQQEAVKFTLRQLRQKVGSLPEEVESQIRALPVERLEELGLALLEFESLAELTTWLDGFSH